MEIQHYLDAGIPQLPVETGNLWGVQSASKVREKVGISGILGEGGRFGIFG